MENTEERVKHTPIYCVEPYTLRPIKAPTQQKGEKKNSSSPINSLKMWNLEGLGKKKGKTFLPILGVSPW